MPQNPPMAGSPRLFELAMQVRDYECDLQGIVNNAVYLNYLEHTRHEFVKSVGLDFAELHQQGQDAVVVRIEVDYKWPLRSRDAFVVRLDVRKEGSLRFVFRQVIDRQPDGRRILEARVVTAFLSGGRPARPPAEVVAALGRNRPD